MNISVRELAMNDDFKKIKSFFESINFNVEIDRFHYVVIVLMKDNFASTHDPVILKHLDFERCVSEMMLAHNKHYIKRKLQDYANG